MGGVKEIKKLEYRVGLTPDNVRAYCLHGHTVAVETGAGLGSGFSDEAYRAAGAEIAPDADVLAFVMPHFADRFPLENFVILDERRAAAGIHPAGKTWFLTKLSKQELDTLQQAGQQKDENEQEIEVLFQSFCRSLSILERQNQPLQQQLVPLKYRMHMTEFQKK